MPTTTSPPETRSCEDTPFEYIVVGSGAGGAPLAARLAEHGHSVLVLEAGSNHCTAESTDPDREISEVPALHGPASEYPEISWEFWVKHYDQPAQQDPKYDPSGRGIFYPRASGIGGCTIHNAMITVAGPASDWDKLAWDLDDRAWSADVMRGYFQKLERCEHHQPRPRPRRPLARALDTVSWLFGRDPDPTVGRHGFDGWLHTSVGDANLALGDPQLLKMLKAAVLASWSAGMEAPSRFIGRVLRGEGEEDLDPNHFRRQSERPEGVVLIPTAIHSKDQNLGHRCGPARRLMDMADKNKKLTIAPDCLVTKIILERKNESVRALGVEYLHGSKLYKACPSPSTAHGVPRTVHARREVILCGGAFNTPQLLMLSGIGPREELRGLQCLVHSPGVGQNLQDRYEVTVVAQMDEPFPLLNGATFKLPGHGPPDRFLADWRAGRGGLYASNGAVLGILKRSRPDLVEPDLFVFGIPLKFMGYEKGYSVVNPKTYNLFTWAILKSHTRNHGGTVTLRSTDPTEPPDINFNYFACDSSGSRDPDLEAVVAGVRFVRTIIEKAGVREWNPGGTPRFPDWNDDEDVRRWIKREAWGHHACGTCRMGRTNDPMAVTDSRFRVLGESVPGGRATRGIVEGLRIVDASIFPDIPGYFIVSNVYMASEKAADVIHSEATA